MIDKIPEMMDEIRRPVFLLASVINSLV